MLEPSPRRKVPQCRADGSFLKAISYGLALSAVFGFATFGCKRFQATTVPVIPVAATTAATTETRAVQEAEMREILGRAPRPEGSYRIGPNDIMDIRVFRNPDMNAVTRVDGNGFIRFPPLGEIEVSGLTERRLEALLEGRLRDKYVKEPQVTVLVTELHPREVSIFGAVSRPGRYPMVGEMRLLDLLGKAGGLSGSAGSSAYVIRYDTPTTHAKEQGESGPQLAERRITIDLDGLLIRGEKFWNIPLWPGDLVNVPVPEPGWIHVTGPGVVRPGTYPLITFLGLQGREVSPTGVQNLVPYPLTRSSKSLRQAIDEAGGIKWEASKSILILRRGEDGKEQFLLGNYRKILRDPRNDIPLQTRDTVIVDRDRVRYVAAVIGRTFAQVFRFTIYSEYDLFSELGLTRRATGVTTGAK